MDLISIMVSLLVIGIVGSVIAATHSLHGERVVFAFRGKTPSLQQVPATSLHRASMTTNTHTRTPWAAAHYSPLATGSGAAKLASSAIAPLVAAARGYSSFSDAESAKAIAKKSSLATGAIALSRKLQAMVFAAATPARPVLSSPTWHQHSASTQNF